MLVFPLIVVDKQSLGFSLKSLENVHTVSADISSRDQNHLCQLFVTSIFFVVGVNVIRKNVHSFCRFESGRIRVLLLVCAAISDHYTFERNLVSAIFVLYISKI